MLCALISSDSMQECYRSLEIFKLRSVSSKQHESSISDHKREGGQAASIANLQSLEITFVAAATRNVTLESMRLLIS